ncbi:glycogen debranching N-terminal domain-containing protein [Micromonospora sp. NPDC051141]|uniref:amylo-alpha-1,6-glucosidase n=1 Tax=Micromonospora sp. NPDC051141 TaxID=3364284 RepID=UPI0037A6555C
MTTNLVSILDGNTFLVTSRDGDIDPSSEYPTGLFSFDTRFVSTWQLSINGERLHALTVDSKEYYQTSFFVVPGRPTQYVNAQISATRHRVIGGSFVEELTVLNHTNEDVDMVVRLDVDCDFADLFEVKNVQPKKGQAEVTVEADALRFAYRREGFHRETVVRSTEPPAIDRRGMEFHLRVKAHGEWRTCFHVITNIVGARELDFRDSNEVLRARSADVLQTELAEWLEAAPTLADAPLSLRMTYRQSLVDLAALRFTANPFYGNFFTAGLPWFMSLFGRDSIFTCLQTLPFLPHTVATTLRNLAYMQGARFDDFREEEPGKIIHEMRFGETAVFQEQPHSPYYGSADSTPLFVILLDEYERWSGDANMIREFELEARAALNWIGTYADLLGTGYVWYECRNTDTGLVNQCWKDSPDSLSYADGRLAAFPVATCELQGYAYDAKVRGARLAREFWDDPGLAAQLDREAAELKDRFNRDFWVTDGEYYALALDGDGRQVDALSSNIGHLLWSGIVDQARASRIAEHLVGPELFSGWGVRTLATNAGRYNPLGYHVGTVWPFDSSIIAWGLWRYGFRAEANRICEGLLDAAPFFNGRLPEVFAGYPRHSTNHPVEYPTACSPQAWSAGAPLLLLRVMLGLQPHTDHLAIDPVIPDSIGRIELLNIPGRWGLIDALGRSR